MIVESNYLSCQSINFEGELMMMDTNYEYDGMNPYKDSMIVYVNIPSKDKTIFLEAGIHDTIGNVKESIGRREKMSVRQLTLINEGLELDDEKTVRYYGIVDWSIIDVVFTPAGLPEGGGGSQLWPPMSVEVKPWHSRQEIKGVIENWTGLGFDGFRFFNGNNGGRCCWDKSQVFVSVYPAPPPTPDTLEGRGVYEGPSFEILVNGCGWKEEIMVNSYWSVYDVKNLIKKFEDEFYCSRNMMKLDDEKTLGFLGFSPYHTEKSMIWSLSLNMIKLSIKMPQVGDGESISLETYSYESIGEIKIKMCDEMGIPCGNQNVYYKGDLLDDNESLGAIGIGSDSVVYAVFGSGETEASEQILNLTVIRTGEKSFDIKVKPYYTVLDVKTVIESFSDIPVCVQEISYSEKLKDWKTVMECGMQDWSGIGLRVNGKYVKIIINTPKGDANNLFVIEAKNSDRVNAVMDMIPREEMECITGKPCLFLGKTALLGNMRIGMYGSSVLRLDRLIEIYVTRPDKVVAKVEVSSFYSVNDVKERVEEMCGIPVGLQKLTYRGDDVHNNETLASYEEVLGSLWVLKWQVRDSFWSFFWPCYVYQGGRMAG